MKITRLTIVAAALAALGACGSPHSDDGANHGAAGSAPAVADSAAGHAALADGVQPDAERRLLAVDATASTAARSGAVAADLEREIGAAYMATGGAGSYLTVADFAGGPGDVQSVDDFELCRGGTRKCADPVAQADRVLAMVDRVDALLADAPDVGGSDPVGFLFHQLSQLRTGFPENPTSVVIWTDFVSRSDVLILDGSTDISTPEARSQVIDLLAAKGLDFGAIDLEGASIEVRLVPTDISAQSAVYAEYVRAFAEDLLTRTNATVTVSLFTATDA